MADQKPKRTAVPDDATGGAVDDPSGTTAPVSGGSGPDLEASQRTAAAPDVAALDVPTHRGGMSMGLLLGSLAAVIGLLALLAFLSWPDADGDDGTVVTPAGDLEDVPAATN